MSTVHGDSVGHLADVFCALQDSTFLEKIDEFSDEQLRPFLPLLITSSFAPGIDPGKCDRRLLGKIASFDEANHLQTLCTLPYGRIESDARERAIDSIAFMTHLRTGTDDAKMLALCHKLLEPDDTDDINAELVPFVLSDQVPEAGMLLSFAIIFLRHICTVEVLSARAISFQKGPEVVVRAIANCPELYYPILNHLLRLNNAKFSLSAAENESPRAKNRATALSLLMSLSPGAAPTAVTDLFGKKHEALLGLRLACVHLQDHHLISFMANEILSGNNSRPLGQLLHRGSARKHVAILHERLVAIARAVCDGETGGEWKADERTSLLLSLAVLNSQSSLKPQQEDWSLLLRLIQSTCTISPTSRPPDSYLLTAVAVIVALPSMISLPGHPPLVIALLKNLREMCSSTGDLAVVHSYLGQSLLFIGVALCTNSTEHLVAFLTDILRAKVSLAPRHVSPLRALFSEAGYDERQLALIAAAQPVTPSLTAAAVSVRLPCNCVHDLLVAGAFQRQRVPITNWVERQISASAAPLHPLMCALLDRLAFSAATLGVPGLSIPYVEGSFTGELTSRALLTRRVLCAFFLLSYRKHYEAAPSVAGRETANDGMYPEELYTAIPLRYLLSVVEVLHQEMVHIRVWLVRYSAQLFPYMLPTDESVRIARQSLADTRTVTLNENSLLRAVRSDDETAALAGIRRIDAAPLSEQVRLLPVVVAAVTASLAPSAPRTFQETACRVWKRLEGAVPRMLIERTAREWLVAGGCAEVPPIEMIYEIPPLLFRSDRRLFSSGPHFSCFLRALSFFSAACHSRIARSIVATNLNDSTDSTRAEREILSGANKDTHAALVVQLLIELCDIDEDERGERKELDEVRELAADQLHQMFIADQQLLKLVLWQMFPLRMLPWLVHSVPSMHVALPMIDEFLVNSDLSRRVFAVALAVELSKEYRIATSLVTTEKVLDVLRTVQRLAPTKTHLSLFARVTPWLSGVIQVFPQLAGDATRLLIHASNVAKSRVALNSLVIRTMNDDVSDLVDEIDHAIARAADGVLI